MTDSPGWRWRVTPDGGVPFEVRVLPEATAAEMALWYPGARIVPLTPSAGHRMAIPLERAELRSLIRQLLPGEPKEWKTVEALAFDDADGALACYRSLVRRLSTPSGAIQEALL